MNDIEMLREARLRPTPSEAEYSAARAALLERAAGPAPEPERVRRFRLPRLGVRLVAVGAAAVTVAAGVAVVQGAGGSGAKTHPIASGHQVVLTAVQQVLGRASSAAQARPFTAPRPHQWIYTQTLRRFTQKPADNTTQGPNAPLHTKVDKFWVRADGKQAASYDQGRLQVGGYGGLPIPTDYAARAALPTDPATLLAWARKVSAHAPSGYGANSNAFQTLGGMFYDGILPPKLEAAIYRALALIPGVTLDHRATDLQGRPLLSVSYTVGGWMGVEILLEPATYAYRGERDVAVAQYDSHVGWKIAKGQILTLITREKTAIVDRPGQVT
jgi:hypothetical protein